MGIFDIVQGVGQGQPEGSGVPSPNGGGGSSDIEAQIKQHLQRGMQERTSLRLPRMNPKMGQTGLGADIGMSLLKTFVPQVGGAIQRAVKHQKEQQITQVVNIANGLHADWERAQEMSGGDPQKAMQIWEQLPSIQQLKNDKKIAKLFSKAFQVDLMNPEKTQNNVAFQGLQRFLNAKQAEGKMKQAKQMMEHFQQIGQSQPQGQPQQNGQSASPIADTIMSQVPQVPREPSMSDVEKVAQSYKDLMSAMYADEPKTEQQQWYRAYKNEHGKYPDTAAIEAHDDAKRLKPMDQAVQTAFDLAEQGDFDGFKKQVDLIHTVASATKPVVHKNFIDLIRGANAGNKDDAADLKKYMALQDEMRMSYGRGRAMYDLRPYVDPQTGRTIVMDSVTYRDKLMKGEFGDAPPVPMGRLTSNQVISIQQLQTEAGTKDSPTYQTGALKGVYDNIKAYDNAKDRVLFAAAMNKAGKSDDWLATMHNALGQIEVGQLSPEGQRLYVNLQRLAETMGRFRSSMGLPSTDSSMNLSLALLPGPATPSSDVAKMLLDNLNQMIDQAYIPALGGKAKPTTSAKPQTTEEKIKALKKAINGN